MKILHEPTSVEFSALLVDVANSKNIVKYDIGRGGRHRESRDEETIEDVLALHGSELSAQN